MRRFRPALARSTTRLRISTPAAAAVQTRLRGRTRRARFEGRHVPHVSATAAANSRSPDVSYLCLADLPAVWPRPSKHRLAGIIHRTVVESVIGCHGCISRAPDSHICPWSHGRHGRGTRMNNPGLAGGLARRLAASAGRVGGHYHGEHPAGPRPVHRARHRRCRPRRTLRRHGWQLRPVRCRRKSTPADRGPIVPVLCRRHPGRVRLLHPLRKGRLTHGCHGWLAQPCFRAPPDEPTRPTVAAL